MLITAEQLQWYDRTTQKMELEEKLDRINNRLARKLDEIDRLTRVRRLLTETIALLEKESK